MAEPLHTGPVAYTRQTEGNVQSDESSDDPETSGLSFSLVQPYVQAVKLAIGWEEADALSKKSKSYFTFLKKQVAVFPLMDQIRGVIEEEWNKTEKRFPVNWLTKLYPLAESDSALLDGPPAVDA